MKAKKLLSILLFSLIVCAMLAVYASATVDSYYFAGDYLKWRVYNNSTDLKNVLSVEDGAVKIGEYVSGTTEGKASFTLNPTDRTASEVSTSKYPYITTQFKTNHFSDLQLWPFSSPSQMRNTADGTKLAAGGDATYGTYNAAANFNTSRNVWWTAKHNFNFNEMTGESSPYWSATPDALENSQLTWKAKSDKNVPEYYHVITINMTGANATTDNRARYANIKYIAMHSKKADMYGSDGMTAMLKVVEMGDTGIVYPITANENEADLKAYIKSAIETKFDGAVVTVGNQLSDKTFVNNATKDYLYQVTVEYEGVKAYDGFNVKVVPAPTFDAVATLGAQVRSDGTWGLRFGFTIDTAAIPANCTLVEYGAVIGKDGTTPVLGNETEYAVVRSTKAGFKVKETAGTVNTYTAVVTNIPDGTGDTVDHRDTKLVARPFVTYTFNGRSFTTYGESVARSYNDVLNIANGSWDN